MSVTKGLMGEIAVEALDVNAKVSEKIQLAGTYFGDGAPLSAARCLREAADMLEEHGNKVNAALEEASGR